MAWTFYSNGSQLVSGVSGNSGTGDAIANLATTTTLASNSYSSGILTATANGVLATIDGVTPVVGNNILVKNEATSANDGLYTVVSVGSSTTQWQLERTPNIADSAADILGLQVWVLNGTTNKQTGWVNTNTTAITLGTTALTFAQNGVLNPASGAGAISTEGLMSARPSAGTGNGVTGSFYYATDVQNLFKSNGSTWELIATGGDDEFLGLPRQIGTIHPSYYSNGAFVADGMFTGGTLTTTGTFSRIYSASLFFNVATTAATIGATASVSGPIFGAGGLVPNSGYGFRTHLANVDPGTGGRMFAGIFTASPFGSDTPTSKCIGFRFSDGTDTTLKIIVYNSSLTITDTGVSSSSGIFDISIICTTTTGNGVAIIRTQSSLTPTEPMVTKVIALTGLPSSLGSNVRVLQGVEAITATAVSLYCGTIKMGFGFTYVGG